MNPADRDRAVIEPPPGHTGQMIVTHAGPRVAM
jgi:hypothetical protein